MNRKRVTVGIILIALSLAAVVFWEVKGRNEILLDEVIVYAQALARDTKIEKHHLAKAKVLKDNRVEGSVDWADVQQVIGKYLTSDVGKKAQVTSKFLREDVQTLEDDQSIFAIPGSWIEMKSSSLRRGDKAEIFESQGLESFGIFSIAFVKDSGGSEVVDEYISDRGGALERWMGSAPVDHLEIIGKLSDYQSLHQAVTSDGALLLLVQREVF